LTNSSISPAGIRTRPLPSQDAAINRHHAIHSKPTLPHFLAATATPCHRQASLEVSQLIGILQLLIPPPTAAVLFSIPLHFFLPLLLLLLQPLCHAAYLHWTLLSKPLRTGTSFLFLTHIILAMARNCFLASRLYFQQRETT